MEEKTYARFKDSIISYKNIMVKTTIVSQNENLDTLTCIGVNKGMLPVFKVIHLKQLKRACPES